MVLVELEWRRGLLPGTSLVTRYRGESVGDERIVMHRVEPSVYVMVTLDRDIFEKDLSGTIASAQSPMAYLPDVPSTC